MSMDRLVRLQKRYWGALGTINLLIDADELIRITTPRGHDGGDGADVQGTWTLTPSVDTSLGTSLLPFVLSVIAGSVGVITS